MNKNSKEINSDLNIDEALKIIHGISLNIKIPSDGNNMLFYTGMLQGVRLMEHKIKEQFLKK